MLQLIKKVLNETPDIKFIQDDLPTKVDVDTIISELIYTRPRTYYLNNRIHCGIDRNRSLSDMMKLCIHHIEGENEDDIIKDVITTVYRYITSDECDTFWCPDIDKMVFTPDIPFYTLDEEDMIDLITEFDEYSFLEIYQDV